MQKAAKILVVDDERGICQNVERILKKNHCEVTQAVSAQEALEKMAKDSYELLISDIVMPGKNGLELLKLVKKEWPLTKAVMMTAYASTDTAMKAIRLGALDYLPKPFTPEELRGTVEKALKGELVEAPVSTEEREAIDVIDIDLPFDAKEVAAQVGEEYMNMLGRSDMPVVEVKIPESSAHFCAVGDMVCDIFKKLGATCKAGTKTGACPQKKGKKAKMAGIRPARDVKKLVAVDQPFAFDEVAVATGPDYARHLEADGLALIPYGELKARIARADAELARRQKAADDAVTTDQETVLVIDDEVAVNNNVRRILAKNNFRVDQASSKPEAMEKIADRCYTLVLLDLKMPDVKGLELLAAIRDKQPQAKVVIITGYATIETAVDAARMGAVGYLPKPFTPDEIRTATESAIRHAA
jgi:DNA-binding response OmpR family regulator